MALEVKLIYSLGEEEKYNDRQILRVRGFWGSGNALSLDLVLVRSGFTLSSFSELYILDLFTSVLCYIPISFLSHLFWRETIVERTGLEGGEIGPVTK